MDKNLGNGSTFSPAAFFDEQFGVSARDMDRVLARAMARRADYADLYFEYRTNEQTHLEEGLVKQASVSTANGVGARVLVEDRTGYAFTDDVTLKNLDSAVKTANVVANAQGSDLPAHVPATATLRHDLYPETRSALGVSLERKIALLQDLDRFARKTDARVKGVFASLLLEHKVVLIASSQGWALGDVQPLVRCNIRCIVEAGGKRQVGYFGWGGRMSLDECTATERCETYAQEAVRRALVNLEAVAAPAGPTDVVLGPGWPGILLHEAIGHGLEADFNRRNTSAFSGRIGERVATELCTVVDDGTIPWRRGSLNVDDEGTPTQRTVLIEKGILRGYMHDRLNASLLGMQLTGNGRRESYAHVPMPRMTNTFMLAGEEDPQDIIRSVKDGLYAVSFGGGQVDITSGKFVFSANEAYRIEGGRVTHPVRDATLIGNGPDVLTRVSRVGADLALDDGIGTCGKDGQGVPVGVGLPTIRIDQIVVGGTTVRGSSTFQG